MTHVTCRLTAKNRDHVRNPTLGSRVWATFTFLKRLASYPLLLTTPRPLTNNRLSYIYTIDRPRTDQRWETNRHTVPHLPPPRHRGCCCCCCLFYLQRLKRSTPRSPCTASESWPTFSWQPAASRRRGNATRSQHVRFSPALCDVAKIMGLVCLVVTSTCVNRLR